MSAQVGTAIETWQHANTRRVAIIAASIALLAASFAADLATGPAMLPILAVLHFLAGLAGDPCWMRSCGHCACRSR